MIYCIGTSTSKSDMTIPAFESRRRRRRRRSILITFETRLPFLKILTALIIMTFAVDWVCIKNQLYLYH